MVNKSNFATLKNRYRFEIQLKLVTPLHIGGGQDEAVTADSPIIVDANKGPYIPGSSFKGVLRTAAERTAHIFNMQPCFLQKGECEPPKASNVANLSEEALFDLIYSKSCPICQTFGGKGVASKVTIHNVYFHTESNTQTRVRTSNAINRETGTAKNGALFTYEYVLPNETCTLVIDAENMDENNLQVLSLALAQLRHNFIRLGGMQSKGLGQIEFVEENSKVSIENYENQSRQDAISLLLGLKERETMSIDEFLQLQLEG